MKYSGFFEEEQKYISGYTRFEFISYIKKYYIYWN